MQKPTRFRQALRRRHRALGLPAPRPMATPHGRSLAVATGDVTIIRTICPPKVQRWLGLEERKPVARPATVDEAKAAVSSGDLPAWTVRGDEIIVPLVCVDDGPARRPERSAADLGQWTR